MAKLKLDLSKVKHLKTENGMTTLQHDDGHTITLAHKALSPENRTQLEALSKIPQQTMQSVDKNMAEGGEARQMFVLGGEAVRNAGAKFKTAVGAYGADPAPAATSHVEGDVRTPEQKSKAQHYYDQPNYNTPTTAPSTTDDEGYTKMAKGGKVPTEPSSEMQLNGPGTMDRAPQGLAQGGNVSGPNNPKLAESHKKAPKYCTYCGQGIHQGECSGGEVKMAEGGDPIDKMVPNYQDPNSANQQPSQQQMPDPQSEAMPKAQQDDKSAILDAYKHNLPDIPRGMKFATPYNSQEAHIPGPNGEPPVAGYDWNAWQNAKNDIANAKEDNAAQIAAGQQYTAQQNKIRGELGQPLLPIPNIPNGPQIPGSEGDPTTVANLPPGETINPLDPSGQNAITATKAGAGTGNKQDLTQDPYAMAQAGYNNQIAGIQGQSKAAQDLAAANAKILSDAQDTKARALAKYQGQFDELNKERLDHIDDINKNLVDPNRYWTGDKDGNGSHSKLAAGIGMILAGFNPTNKPNAAIEFLKYQMDKNMQAQVSNLGAKESMLSANLRQFGNLKDAITMTHLMQSDIVANQLQQAAATAATPQAKAAALTAAGQLQQQTAPAMQQFAMQRAMMNMANDPNGTDDAGVQHMIGYLRMFNPQAGENMAKRFVPGVGLSPTQEVPQDVRQKLIAHQNLTKFATDLKTFIQAHGGALDRMSLDLRAQAAAMALPVQAAFREGALGTVYREGEQPLLDKAVKGQPLDMASYFINTEPTKLDVMLKTNENQANILKKAYDLPIRNQSPTSMEGQTIVNKSTGQRMKMVNGKWTSIK